MTYLKGYNEPAYYLSSFNFFTWITSFNGYKIIQGKSYYYSHCTDFKNETARDAK